MNYMVHVSSTMWRIKHQPSNSISCSDNALCLLVLVVVVQYSKMPFQFMNTTPNPFRLTFIRASSVSRLSLVLFLILTQFCVEKPRSQTIMLVGITSVVCHSDIRVGPINHELLVIATKNPQASCIPRCSQTKDNIFTYSSIDEQGHHSMAI